MVSRAADFAASPVQQKLPKMGTEKCHDQFGLIRVIRLGNLPRQRFSEATKVVHERRNICEGFAWSWPASTSTTLRSSQDGSAAREWVEEKKCMETRTQQFKLGSSMRLRRISKHGCRIQ